MARIQGQLEGIGKRDHAADVRRAAGLRSAGPLPDSRGQSARDVRRRRRSVRVDRLMILDRSTWRPAGEADPIPERRLVVTRPAKRLALPRASSPRGSWPSFRGAQASGIAEGQSLPDSWDGPSGRNIVWRTPIPGLAHSSPVVWGDRLFVTTAISSRGGATFKPGLYRSPSRPRRSSLLSARAACLKRSSTGSTSSPRPPRTSNPLSQACQPRFSFVAREGRN